MFRVNNGAYAISTQCRFTSDEELWWPVSKLDQDPKGRHSLIQCLGKPLFAQFAKDRVLRRVSQENREESGLANRKENLQGSRRHAPRCRVEAHQQ
jgi:hypothetical protein